MKINPKFQALIPPLSPEEFSQLETNIIADGCRDPLVTWDGTLIDGHNRYAICKKHGIEFDTKPMQFEDEALVRIWMRNNQRGRRNLTDAWKIELELGNKNDLAELGKKKMTEGGGDRTSSAAKEKAGLSNNDKPAAEPKHDTRKAIAKAVGVSTGKVAQAEVVKKKSPELWEKAKAGEITVHAAYKAATVHVGQNSGENEWYTPVEFVEAAREVMGGIDCDPASCEIANRTVNATKFFDKDADGLRQKWNGRIFLNPPYAKPLISQFAEALASKFENDEIKQAVVLVNNATETGWFARIASQASAVCFPSSRIRFLDPSGAPSGAPLQGQSILYLGANQSEFCKRFATIGIVCHVLH